MAEPRPGVGRRRDALVYGGWQVGVQMLGVVAGFLVVRALPKTDYAWYALTFAMISAAMLIADSGFAPTMMARGAEALRGGGSLRSLVRAGLRERRVWPAVVALGASALLVVQLRANGAPLWELVALVGVFVAAFLTQAFSSVFANVFRIVRDTRTLRESQAAGAVIRLAAIIAVIAATTAATAVSLSLTNLVAAAVTLAWLWFGLRRPRARHALSSEDSGADQPDHAIAFRANLRRTLPATAALIAVEQYFLLLTSLRGTPEVVAEISAFARFGLVFFVVNAVASDVVAPHIAHLAPERRVLSRAFTKSVGAYVGFSAAVLIATIALLGSVLGLFGPEYAGLGVALVIVCAAYAAINLGHTVNALVQARGWLSGWWVYVTLAAVWAAAGFAVDLTNVNAAAIYFALQAVPYLAMQGYRIARGLGSTPVAAASVARSS